MLGENPSAVEAVTICKGFRSLFQRKEVLKEISLDIDGSEIFGILGPNGSGKTTLLSIFSTLIYPDSGSLSVMGFDARRETGRVREIINISTGKANFPWSLTVRENLIHYGMLYGLYGRALAGVVEEVMESFDLFPYKDQRFEGLSSGLKQRVSLARAMLNHPKLLFLDEPTTGLDPQMSIKTRELIRRVHQEMGVAVVLTTHYMPEAEQLCERVAFLKEGRIVAQDTPRGLKRQMKLGERMSIRYNGEIDRGALEEIAGVICAKCSAGLADLVIERTPETISRVMKTFRATEILDIDIQEPDLEDVFLELAR